MPTVILIDAETTLMPTRNMCAHSSEKQYKYVPFAGVPSQKLLPRGQVHNQKCNCDYTNNYNYSMHMLGKNVDLIFALKQIESDSNWIDLQALTQ